MRRELACSVAALGLLLVGCGSGSSNRLYGSVKEAYGGLPFDQVEVKRQDPDASYIVYYRESNGNIQVKVVAKAPVVEGVQKDLVKDGALERHTNPMSSFPDMESGNITFDTLSDVGSSVSGRFYVTFQANPASGLTVKGTLNGEFSATLQKQ